MDNPSLFMYIGGMDFTFGNINLAVSKKNQEKIAVRTHFGSAESRKPRHVLFLVETPLSKIMETALNIWIRGIFTKAFDYDIVSASTLGVSEEDIKKNGIFRFYQQNKTQYESYIRPNETVVVTFGMALSAVTLSSDLSYECFQDYVFNKTYFYSPRLDVNVFPVDSLDRLFELVVTRSAFYKPYNCSRVQFALRQFATIKSNHDQLKITDGVTRTRIVKLRTKQDWHDFYIEHNRDKRKVSWDIETSGLSHFRNRVLCVTMSFDGVTGYYIPWNIIDVGELSDFFKDRYQIGQNLKFDIKFLSHRGVKNLRINSDTLQLGHLLNEMRFNGLKSLAYYYTTHGGYDFTLDEYIDRYKPADYSEIPEGLLSEYATMDAIVTYQVHEAMQLQLSRLDELFPPPKADWWTMRDYYEKVKIPAFHHFIDIEMRGFYIDREKWDQGCDVIEMEVVSIKDKLRERLGMPEDSETLFYSLVSSEDDEAVDTKDALQSGKQMGELLESLGWECLGRTKQGWYNTGDECLKRWAQLGHEEAPLIQQMRSYLTLQKTFLGKSNDDSLGWRRYIDQHGDGSERIHPTYKSMLMDTHRNGCGDPNYQQLPSSSLGAEHMKKIITVPDIDKYYLCTLDYSGFQIRLAAVDSEDPVLLKAYRDNPDVDLHLKTAYSVFMREAEFDIEEVIITDGDRKFIKFPHEEVEVMRDGKKIKVKAGDLIQTDSLV